MFNEYALETKPNNNVEDIINKQNLLLEKQANENAKTARNNIVLGWIVGFATCIQALFAVLEFFLKQ